MRAIIGFIVGAVITVLLSDALQYGVSQVAVNQSAAILFSWIIGTLAGAIAADLIGRRAWPGYAIAALLLLVVIYTVSNGNQPWWLAPGGLVGPLLAAWLAARIVADRS